MRLIEITAPPSEAWTMAPVSLQFLLRPTDAEHLDALREARRATIREEWTRGALDGDPPLADAYFTASQVVWEIPIAEEPRCREKLSELVRRANDLLGEGSRR